LTISFVVVAKLLKKIVYLLKIITRPYGPTPERVDRPAGGLTDHLHRGGFSLSALGGGEGYSRRKMSCARAASLQSEIESTYTDFAICSKSAK
jgi:hypothetical protein